MTCPKKKSVLRYLTADLFMADGRRIIMMITAVLRPGGSIIHVICMTVRNPLAGQYIVRPRGQGAWVRLDSICRLFKSRPGGMLHNPTPVEWIQNLIDQPPGNRVRQEFQYLNPHQMKWRRP
jgi:hypothetical protein